MHLCKRPFSSTVYLSDCPNARRLSSYSPTIFNGRYPFTCVISRCGTRLLLVESNLMTLIVVIVAAIILEYLRMIYSTYSEISIAILMSGGLALALVLMNLTGGNSAASIQSYLFGSIVTITWDQVVMLAILFVVLVLLFMLFKRPMYVLTFDEDTAHVDGLPIHWMSMLLM